ncbi:SLATT domain-containing protein [Fortiea sp. LEGE XX443]|uniref:SLATT domain-containing protein n=1 Tax=Fortiea sp. LEGE XX443 TaxID=1828611 RepID=UPI0018808C07|nr:SLATT domain-containing protein [Fortiea sp. LEGE XX443]MBE9003803.1 SLATT domain-containing protein [Fortiea sp. LEGE XX443]
MNILKEIKDLEKNSRLVKNAHFLAVQQKQYQHRFLGVLIIIINIIIFSPFLDLVIPKYSPITVKFLAIISASLAGVQTLFNYQKDIELHLSAGDKYANIYHKAGVLLAKNTDGLIQQDDFIKEFEVLFKDYLDANTQYKACIPSNNDFEKAEQKIKQRSQRNTSSEVEQLDAK